jgi:hypothetical protein
LTWRNIATTSSTKQQLGTLAGSHHRHHAHRFYLTGGYQDLPHRFGEQLDTEPPPG